MTRAHRSVTWVAALVLTGAAGTPAAAPKLKEWIRGPVRYIAESAEIDAFKRLTADADRAAFVERFWTRRDPTPETLVNERRQLFWERVREANALFIDGTAPGWKTDRGKVYILYGPPSRIEEDPYARVGDSTGTGLLRWHYEGSEATGRPEMGPAVVVPFVRNIAGEYRLSFEPQLASEFYDWEAIKLRSDYERWLGSDAFSPSRSPLAVMLDLGKMQEVPPQEQVLLERVDAYEVLLGPTLQVDVHRYFDPEGDNVVVSLTALVPERSDATGRPALIARLLPRGLDGKRVLLGEDSFRFDGSGIDRQAQARVAAEPGSYDLTVLAVYPRSVISSLYRARVRLPDPDDDGVRVSDVAVARSLEPLPYRSLASYREPFVVGAFRVVPRVGSEVPRGEEVAFFFEAYGGRLPYRVTYRLERQADEGRWVALGRPVVQEGGQGAQGWSLPTADSWPTGEYRVDIQVSDADGAAQGVQVPFRLVEPDSS